MSSPLSELLLSFSKGEIDLLDAMSKIRMLSYREVGEIAKIDPWREDRIGVPEAVLAEGKSPEDLTSISLAHLDEAGTVIVTRVSESHLKALRGIELPLGSSLEWYPKPKIALLRSRSPKPTGGRVGILCAGTADIPVAEEARIVAEEMGCEVTTEYDVGVAGIHRLFPSLEKMAHVHSIVVAAGREGTLPAIVAGIAEAPVIGLPVSTGYGFGGNGQAALFSMLQSCSVLTVVNIDAGFVAGAFAAKIANQRVRTTRL